MKGVAALTLLALVALMTMGISVCGSSVPAPTPRPTPPLTGDTIITPTARERTPVPAPTLGPISTQTPYWDPSQNQLTADQQHQLEAIVRSDPEVAEIARSVSYSLREEGPWIGDADPVTGETPLIGAIATIAFSQPIPHVEHDFKVESPRPYYAAWPAEAKAKHTPYSETVEHKSIDNLRRIYVSVDFTTNEIASMRVLSEFGQTVTDQNAGPTPQYTRGASPQARDIFNQDRRVAALLAGHQYTVVDQYTVQYTIGTAHLASLLVTFQGQQDIEGDWLILIDFDVQTGAYTNDVINFKATDVQAVGVTIDLDRSEVAFIQPDNHFND